MMKKIFFLSVLFIVLGGLNFNLWAFDHNHSEWDHLLKKHVVLIEGGNASQVNYSGFKNDHQKLKKYLESLSSVKEAEFSSWPKDKRLAFLINAYNAFTIDLILTKYPQIDSIKDIGGFFSSPWKKKFIYLLGKKIHLDEIEHGIIRKKGVYDEPLIHIALVCAAIGCPALKEEAYIHEKLDGQLQEALVRFLSDRKRNRFNRLKNRLEVSSIFKWYKADFETGARGYTSIKTFFSKNADILADTAEDKNKIQSMNFDINYLEYDWVLNDSN
jgi:hypothetical protein